MKPERAKKGKQKKKNSKQKNRSQFNIKNRKIMKQRMYVSLPITGHDLDQAKAKAADVKRHFTLQGDYEVITPFDICTDQTASYSYCMGRDVEALIDSQVIYMCKGWKESKGCGVEYYIAKTYGLTIIEE